MDEIDLITQLGFENTEKFFTSNHTAINLSTTEQKAVSGQRALEIKINKEYNLTKTVISSREIEVEEENYYIVEIIGKIDLVQLPWLYRKITEGDSAFPNGFINVFDLMGRTSREPGDDQKEEGERNGRND